MAIMAEIDKLGNHTVSTLFRNMEIRSEGQLKELKNGCLWEAGLRSKRNMTGLQLLKTF
jgi:hypothetical protein